MWAVIGLLSFVGFLIYLVLGLISAFRKNGLAKKRFLTSLILLFVLIVASSLDPSTQTETASTDDSFTEVLETTLTRTDANAPTEEVEGPSEEEKATQESEVKLATDSEAKIEVATNSVDWEASVIEIAKSDQLPTEKADATEMLAREYIPTSVELDEFEMHITNVFKSGEYLKDAENADYMLHNLFQSVVVERNSESDSMKDFAFDFYQNTKYVFRGAETADSESVLANESQMMKAIN